MPEVKKLAQKRSFDWDKIIVGGPGAKLIEHFYPDYFGDLSITFSHKPINVLQSANPKATRTTTGCIRTCPWCAVPILEPGGLKELDDWPDLPILIDNNLLAASLTHFDRVIDRLLVHGTADINQGLDARLMTAYHANRFASIPNKILRLALDDMMFSESWENAFELLRRAAIPLKAIRSYALIGFNSGPEEAWKRCEWIESHGIHVMPMWYHPINTLEHNIVSPDQLSLGWTDYERRRIMQWYYQHKKAVINSKR
jgi:hypothetical protein